MPEISPNFNKLIDNKEVTFSFRKVTDEVTKIETKRPAISSVIPVPSVEGIIAILEAGGSQLSLLQEAVQDVVYQRARDFLADNPNATSLDLSVLSWEAISNQPVSERKGRGISVDTWKEFATDYIAVMPSVTGKTAEQVGNAAKILLNKFSSVKTNKLVINMLKTQLAIYLNSSPQAESYMECVAFLTQKADALLQADEASILNGL